MDGFIKKLSSGQQIIRISLVWAMAWRGKAIQKGTVLVEGPKWCGKTTTSEQHAKSINYVSAPANLNRNLIMAEMNINSLLDGEKPKLLDEWQVIPQLWDAVRFAIDHSKGIGQFILTGSAVPPTKDQQEKIHHTGTGRITTLRMRPMSFLTSSRKKHQYYN